MSTLPNHGRMWGASAPWYTTVVLLVFVFVSMAAAQQAAVSGSPAVPPLIKFKGAIPDVPSGLIGVTFALYSDQSGGAPLWLETQNVSVDDKGGYTVYLGTNHSGRNTVGSVHQRQRPLAGGTSARPGGAAAHFAGVSALCSGGRGRANPGRHAALVVCVGGW